MATARLQDPLLQHARPAAIYTEKLDHSEVSHLTRHEQVLPAQLRSGHCNKLTAYQNIIDPSIDAMCNKIKCLLSPYTLEHWLQKCPATQQQRLAILDTTNPLLNILTLNRQQVTVILYARDILS